MSKWTYLKLQQLMLLTTLLVIIAVFYLQYMIRLEPCPLCIAQRFCAFLFAFACLIGLRVSTKKQGRLIAWAQILFSSLGLFLAIRQLWLMMMGPETAAVCLPGLDVLIHYFSWHEVFFALFWGTGSCAEVGPTFLGLSIPAWAAIYFVVMLFMSIIVVTTVKDL